MTNGGYLLKPRKARPLGEKGFTLVELLVVTGLSAVFTGLILAALISSRQVCTSVTADQDLQQTANMVLNKIIKGGSETGGTFRLSEATSYTIATISELHFVGTDGTERRYFLDNTGKALWYRHPGAGGTVDELIYRAPAATTLTLRFWPVAGASYTNVTIGIDFGLSKLVNGRTIAGSASTLINIRNHTT